VAALLVVVGLLVGGAGGEQRDARPGGQVRGDGLHPPRAGAGVAGVEDEDNFVGLAGAQPFPHLRERYAPRPGAVYRHQVAPTVSANHAVPGEENEQRAHPAAEFAQVLEALLDVGQGGCVLGLGGVVGHQDDIGRAELPAPQELIAHGAGVGDAVFQLAHVIVVVDADDHGPVAARTLIRSRQRGRCAEHKEPENGQS